MVGFGPPASRQRRREWWRRQIQRQHEGSLTVAEFCRRLGVSTVTFYAWKRRFREAPPASPLAPERPSSARPKPEANGASTPAFLPVSIRDGVLTVQVIQPAVRYELDRSWKRDIVRKLQIRFGAKIVREVCFRG